MHELARPRKTVEAPDDSQGFDPNSPVDTNEKDNPIMPQNTDFHNRVSITFSLDDAPYLTEDDVLQMHTLVYNMTRQFGAAAGNLVTAWIEDEDGRYFEYDAIEVESYANDLSEFDLALLYKWAAELHQNRERVALMIGDDTFLFWG